LAACRFFEASVFVEIGFSVVVVAGICLDFPGLAEEFVDRLPEHKQVLRLDYE
jgi:hypothetical protein